MKKQHSGAVKFGKHVCAIAVFILAYKTFPDSGWIIGAAYVLGTWLQTNVTYTEADH